MSRCRALRSRLPCVAALALVGLQGTLGADQAYEIPAGDRLVLQKPLQVSPGTAHLWIQAGELSVKVNHYYPACQVEVEHVMDSPQTIRPDEFVIKESVNSRDSFSRGMDAYKTRMTLSSKRQPNVRSVTCEVWDDAAMGGFLTRDQIQSTLKGLFSMEGR